MPRAAAAAADAINGRSIKRGAGKAIEGKANH
jgi:hypothetical protein